MDALALLLADSRFPAGGYAHSLGLEQAVADGLTDVPAFLRARLRLVAEADARVAVAARRVAATTPALVALDDEWSARCPSPVLRAVARRLGSRLLRTAETVWPDERIAAYRQASKATPRPIALGVVGAVAGLDDEPSRCCRSTTTRRPSPRRR